MTTSETEARNPEWWQRVRKLQDSQLHLWPSALVPGRTPWEGAERRDETALEVEYL